MASSAIDTIPPHQMHSFIEKQIIQSFVRSKIENPKMSKKDLCVESGCSINKMNQLLKKHGYANMIQKRNNVQNRSKESIIDQNSEKKIKIVKNRSKENYSDKGGKFNIEDELERDPRKN